MHRAASASLAILFALAPARATELAPYVWSWGATSTLVEAPNLTTATLAFVIAGAGCRDDGMVRAMAPEVERFRAKGGRVILSFGGQAGTPIEAACGDDDQLLALIESVMDALGTRALDFDVEGPQLENGEASARRTRVLRRLQAKHPGLTVSLTLPVAPDGLPAPALDLVKSTVAGGVHLSVVNIMTMDYGRGTTDLGAVAIRSAEATISQLEAVFPYSSRAQRFGRLGITPMIGRNDDGSVFTVADARQVARYAAQKGLGRLSFWALQRDRPGASIETASGVDAPPFAYFDALRDLPPPPVRKPSKPG